MSAKVRVETAGETQQTRLGRVNNSLDLRWTPFAGKEAARFALTWVCRRAAARRLFDRFASAARLRPLQRLHVELRAFRQMLPLWPRRESAGESGGCKRDAARDRANFSLR